MTDTVIDRIQACTEALKLAPYAGRLPEFLEAEQLGPGQLDAVYKVLAHLKDQKNETIIHTLLKMSRLPLKEPKTFECTNSFSLTLFTSSAYKQVKGYKQIPETEKKNKR